MKYLWLSLVLLCGLVSVGLAQCPGGVCGPVGPAAQQVSTLEWKLISGTKYDYALLRDGRQIGAWNAQEGQYMALFANGSWGPVGTPPIDPPTAKVNPCSCGSNCLCEHCKPLACPAECDPDCYCHRSSKVSPKTNFGLDRSKISKTERCTINGKSASMKECVAAVFAAGVPDDANLLRLTIISDSKDKRDSVIKDLASKPELESFKGKLVVNDYETSHWAAKPFQPGKDITLVVQSPDGHELARQNDYNDGASGLQANLQMAMLAYDPSKTPDARQDFISQAVKWAEANPL